MGRCSMAEWRWEQEDAAIIQKIMRGFLIRKEQKVTFKKVTTKGRFAPGVSGVSPPGYLKLLSRGRKNLS